MSLKTEFYVKLFDDESSREKSTAASRLETALDDSRNQLPPDYIYFVDAVPFGSRIKVPFELCSD